MTSQANRYQVAYHKVMQDFPEWKRRDLQEDLKKKEITRLVDEFNKEVVRVAEEEGEIFATV